MHAMYTLCNIKNCMHLLFVSPVLFYISAWNSVFRCPFCLFHLLFFFLLSHLFRFFFLFIYFFPLKLKLSIYIYIFFFTFSLISKCLFSNVYIRFFLEQLYFALFLAYISLNSDTL